MKTRSLLIATAVIELTTGIALLVTPSLTVELLLGEALGSAASIVVGRLAGAALIAIGLSCWLERETNRGGSQTGLLVGLLTYNGAVPVFWCMPPWSAECAASHSDQPSSCTHYSRSGV
jgi:hypothetical protein